MGARGADRLAQAAADTYLVPLRLSVTVRIGHVRSPRLAPVARAVDLSILMAHL
jgi:hypothetical protein